MLKQPFFIANMGGRKAEAVALMFIGVGFFALVTGAVAHRFVATGIHDVAPYLVQEYVAAESLDLAVREWGPAPVGDAVHHFAG